MSRHGKSLRRPAGRAGRLSAVLIAVFAAIGQTQEVAAPDLKSEDTALWLSLGSTLVPTAAGFALMAGSDEDDNGVGALLAFTGLYIGPAIGYWYGGAAGRGWKGVGIRTGAGLVGTLAIVAICGDDRCNLFDEDDGTTGAAAIVALVTGGVVLGSAIYDIGKVKSHVRRANQEKLETAGPHLAVAPVVSPAGGGTLGVVGHLRF